MLSRRQYNDLNSGEATDLFQIVLNSGKAGEVDFTIESNSDCKRMVHGQLSDFNPEIVDIQIYDLTEINKFERPRLSQILFS